MTGNRRSTSFSAYSASADVPQDFAPIRAESAARGASAEVSADDVKRRKPWWLLALALLGLAVVLANHYRGIISDTVAEYAALVPDLNIPVINMPEFDRPVINRTINTVRMESPLTNVTEQEVRSLLARYTESGFLGVDVQDLKQELEQNPWIHHASVRRVWPDALVIRLEEEQGIARWGESDLLNIEGEIFSAPWRGGESELPGLSGPQGMESQVLQRYRQYADMLAGIGMSVEAVALDERGSWQIETADGLTLKLGRAQADERLARFVSIHNRGMAAEIAAADIVDLRYNNGFSVSKRSAPTDTVASR
ncbi:cell division protein FtsQ/DivIB [Pseudohongiella sp. SYSU M77423]|uniref:cell division protein FtsQ/DivIB n=1 Tax=unclassified Pseudohongiella TaxID=2629611 RepID=UPI001F32A593|nr:MULTISPECIES: cell division protein FtsQ/DivIB [unclassified Pseudohongiella]MDH7944569.1 cell division protein FtsQ/DivIB [Pseudohongiella sp. SYSU M77423]